VRSDPGAPEGPEVTASRSPRAWSRAVAVACGTALTCSVSPCPAIAGSPWRCSRPWTSATCLHSRGRRPEAAGLVGPLSRGPRPSPAQGPLGEDECRLPW